MNWLEFYFQPLLPQIVFRVRRLLCEKEFVWKRVPKIRLIWRFGLTQTMEMQIMCNPNCMFMPTYSIWFLVLLSCRRQQLKNYPQEACFSMAQYANGFSPNAVAYDSKITNHIWNIYKYRRQFSGDEGKQGAYKMSPQREMENKRLYSMLPICISRTCTDEKNMLQQKCQGEN